MVASEKKNRHTASYRETRTAAVYIADRGVLTSIRSRRRSAISGRHNLIYVEDFNWRHYVTSENEN